MTHHSNLEIKAESFSPTTLNIKAEPYSPTTNSHISRGSRAADRTMSRDGTPAKRSQSETEDLQASRPETKQKLQTALLGRRKANGLTGIPSNLFEKPKVCQLTKADIEKREKRKEQNRKAAKKCRAKKKELQDKTEKKTVHYAETNRKLYQRLYAMYRQMCTLTVCLSQHLDCADCKISAQTQEEHRRYISQTKTFLESCAYVCTPGGLGDDESSLAADSDEASQLSSISDNNNARTTETPTSHCIKDSMDQQVLSSFAEYGNLGSFDFGLADINPDIPLTAFSEMDTTESVTQLASITAADSQLNAMYLRDEAFINGSAPNSTYFPVDTIGPVHEDDLCMFDSSRAADHHDRVPTSQMFNESGYLRFGTSPNVVQSTLTGVRSCPSLTMPATAQNNVYSRFSNRCSNHVMTQLHQVHSDVNNNREKPCPAAQRGDIFSVNMDYSSMSINLPHNYSSTSPNTLPSIFTFERDQSSPDDVGPSGVDPMSPFLTQGGGRRMDTAD